MLETQIKSFQRTSPWVRSCSNIILPTNVHRLSRYCFLIIFYKGYFYSWELYSCLISRLSHIQSALSNSGCCHILNFLAIFYDKFVNKLFVFTGRCYLPSRSSQTRSRECSEEFADERSFSQCYDQGSHFPWKILFSFITSLCTFQCLPTT